MDLLSSNKRIDTVGLGVKYRAVARVNETSLPVIKEIQGSHPDCP